MRRDGYSERTLRGREANPCGRWSAVSSRDVFRRGMGKCGTDALLWDFSEMEW